jgi:outer membrane protein insertion porin family
MLPQYFWSVTRCTGAFMRRCIMPCAGLLLISGAAAQTVQTFEAVEVQGAEFIPEHDIQMTCGAVEGVPYLTIELRAIEDCLMSTGVFETVKLIPNGETLVIAVKELNTRPGRVEASLSYASQDGLIGGLFFERYNLLPDTYGSIRLEYNPEVKRGGGRLYRTNVLGSDFDLGVKLGWEELSFDDSSYSKETKQIETYLAWMPSQKTQLEMGVGYRDYRLFDVDDGASALLVAEQTPGISAPFLRFALNHSSLSEGENGWGTWEYSVGVDQYFWNLGTDDSLSDFRFESRSYVPLGQKWRMLVSLDAGRVSSLDGKNATRVIDRFAPGAGSFRGFAPRGVGPHDNGDALGGNTFAVSSIEIQGNFEDVVNAPLVGGVFLDTGASWALDDTLGGVIDDGFHRRSSVGLSLAFEVGRAPVSLFVAKPIDKQDGDKEQVFGLRLSTAF